MTYALSVSFSINTNQSVLLWVLLSKTKIFPLGNIVMLLFLMRNVVDYCDRSVLLWYGDLGTKKLISPKVLTLVVSVFSLSSLNVTNYILVALVRSTLHRNNTVSGIQAISSEKLNGIADANEQRMGTSDW